MIYGKAERTHGPRFSRKFEPDFQRHDLAHVQRRRPNRPAGIPLTPAGNYRRVPIALETSRAKPPVTGAPPPSPAAEKIPPETSTKPCRAPSVQVPDAFPERDYAGGTWSSAWAVVCVLLLALVVVSSLSTTRPSLTDDAIARAAHHMPRERGADGRN